MSYLIILIFAIGILRYLYIVRSLKLLRSIALKYCLKTNQNIHVTAEYWAFWPVSSIWVRFWVWTFLPFAVYPQRWNELIEYYKNAGK